MFKRSSGILLHITSLPTLYGVGDFGPSAFFFVDWLKKSGQSLWQLLPLGVADRHGCPYAGLCAFGGDPLMISPERLVDWGLLEKSSLPQYVVSRHQSADVDYKTIRFVKHSIFRQAFLRYRQTGVLSQEFDLFCIKRQEWIDDLATFLALTEHYGDKWWQWPNGLSQFGSDAVLQFRRAYRDEIEFHAFLQFLFDKQWFELKHYANQAGIQLVGDIPIFVAHHSMDVWKKPGHFKLTASGELATEAGAAPDGFSAVGQKWGTPLYQWEKMQADQFSWWRKRMRYMLETFDVIRLDHFRGFCAVWEVPHHDPDASNGKWYQGPAEKLFKALENDLGRLPLIVEDLGQITPDVIELRDSFNFPGMKILQEAFSSDETNEHLPDAITEDYVVYTGTHDMNTTNGKFWSLPRDSREKQFALHELGLNHTVSEVDFSWPLIQMAFQSRAQMAIIPMQDILGLGNEARMNMPGVVEGNWKWRFSYDQLDPYAEMRLNMLSKATKRNL